MVKWTPESVVSAQSVEADAYADADADARSISTWSSFSSGERGLAIDVPLPDSGLFEMGERSPTVCEMGEKSPVLHELPGAAIKVAGEGKGMRVRENARERVRESILTDLPLQRPAEALRPSWMSRGKEEDATI
jgi:hypothetical protein